MNEAMGLASMNPVVGPIPGAYIVNVLNNDKDLSTTWNSYNVSKTLDDNDLMFGVDNNGKLVSKNKSKLKDKVVEVYSVKRDNIDSIYESIEKELKMEYDKRPVHSTTYIYELFTGKELLSDDQLNFDPLLEKVELPKLSAIISSDADNIKAEFDGIKKSKKDSNYIPDSFPQGTENLSNGKFPLLASKDITLAKRLLLDKASYISIYEDANGFYAYNELTHRRTASYKTMNNIYFEVIE